MKHTVSQLHDIEKSLNLEFSDISLLEQALVHSSFVSEFPGVFKESNERFEFLGDAVLDLVIAKELVDRFPDSSEGQLTQMRAALVDKASFSGLGRKLGLGQWLVMGKGEIERGGEDRDSNLADAFEALLAALFLDQGYDAARDFVLRVMNEELESVTELEGPPRHPKSLLHEAAMDRGFTPPIYQVIGRDGPDHGPTFTVQALVNGKVMGKGEGASKQEAEAEAATKALEWLGS